MKRASLFASAAVATLLAGASAMPVFAQGTGGPFADVPVDHWAYKAVDTLQKDGIVIGYPDGTYGGKRAMTRYEFAVAIARLLDKIPAAPDLTKYVTQDQLNTALTPYALKTDLAGFAKQSDLDALKKLVDEFQTELTTLGVDLDATKRRLAALEGRVAAIEQELKRVQIGGDVNIMARGNNRFGSSGKQITDADGFLVTGTGQGSLLHDSRVLHDVDISVKAKLSDTATAETVIDYGNYLPYLGSVSSYSNQNTAGAVGRSLVVGPSGTSGTYVNQSEDFTVYKAVIETPLKLPALGGANLTVGRLPIQFTPYTLKLIDTDSYFFNSKTDLGDVPVDGGKITLNLGPVGLTGFAAKLDPIEFVSDESSVFGSSAYGLYAGAAYGGYTGPGGTGGFSGVGIRSGSYYGTTATTSISRPTGSAINPLINGAMLIEQMAGVRANIGTGKIGTIGATYLYAAGNPVGAGSVGTSEFNPDGTVNGNYATQNFNRVAVYGADINTNIIGLGIVGSYTKSDTQGPTVNSDGTLNTGSHSQITKYNDAWDAAATYAKGSFSLTGGYKNVEPYFGAPGSWDKIGAYTNPTDIKGPYVKGKLNFSNSVGLEVAAKFYQGTGDAADNGGLLTSDKIQNLKAGLKFGLTSASSVDAGIERTQYTIGGVGADGNTGDKPVEYFYNIGYGYSFTPAASFKVLYQIVDYRDVNSGFDPLSGKGGIAATQFSVKF